MRRTTLAVALAALLVLAGCADVEVGNSPTPTGVAGGGSTPTDAAGAEDTRTPTTGPEAGLYGQVVEDGAAAASNHREALRTAGSFTYRGEVIFRDGDETVVVNRTARVGGGGEVAASRTRGPTFDRRTYVDGSEVYRRHVRDGKVDTGSGSGGAGVLDRYYGQGLRSLLAAADLEYRKNTTAGGATGDLYVATGDAVRTDDRNLTYFDPDSVDEARLSVVFDGAGVVRSIQYRVRATDGRSVTLSVVYRNVGSTDRPGPDWVEAVRSGDTADDQRLPTSVTRSFVDRARAGELLALVEGEPMVAGFHAFERARASEVVFREDTAETNLVIPFTAATVPDSTDEEYHLYRFDPETGELQRVESSLNTASDEHSAAVTEGFYVVLHRPTYEGERNG